MTPEKSIFSLILFAIIIIKASNALIVQMLQDVLSFH